MRIYRKLVGLTLLSFGCGMVTAALFSTVSVMFAFLLIAFGIFTLMC